jgi:hypothetical protein
MDTIIVSVLIGLLIFIGLLIIQAVYDIKMDAWVEEINGISSELRIIEKEIEVINCRIMDLERNSEADV